MLGLNSNTYRVEDPTRAGDGDFPSDFGSAGNQIHPDDALGEFNFAAMKGVKWQIPAFDGRTMSWRRFEMEFLMAMRHLRLDCVLDGDREEVPFADRALSRDRR